LNSGSKQTQTTGLSFSYGIVSLPSPTSAVSYNDFAGRDVKGKAIMWMSGTPAVLAQGGRGRVGGNGRITRFDMVRRRYSGTRRPAFHAADQAWPAQEATRLAAVARHRRAVVAAAARRRPSGWPRRPRHRPCSG
jgi:hypothetical protein